MKAAIIGAGNVGKTIFHDLQYVSTIREITLIDINKDAARLHDAFKKEPFRIFYGKGYTNTGVSAAACRIAAAISADSREVFPVSSVLQGQYGVRDVAVSVPSILGRNGIEEIRACSMTEAERQAFLASVEVVRQAAAAEGIL